jgi:hypothetical protein
VATTGLFTTVLNGEFIGAAVSRLAGPWRGDLGDAAGAANGTRRELGAMIGAATGMKHFPHFRPRSRLRKSTHCCSQTPSIEGVLCIAYPFNPYCLHVIRSVNWLLLEQGSRHYRMKHWFWSRAAGHYNDSTRCFEHELIHASSIVIATDLNGMHTQTVGCHTPSPTIRAGFESSTRTKSTLTKRENLKGRGREDPQWP